MRRILKKYQNVLIIIGVAVVAFLLGLVSRDLLGDTGANLTGAAGAMAGQETCPAVEWDDSVPTGIVLADPLNFRIGPGLDYSIITTLDYCTPVKLLGRTSDSAWLLVQYQGNVEGWVFSYYINPNIELTDLEIATGYGGPDTPSDNTTGERSVSVVIQYNQAVAFVTGMPANEQIVAVLGPQNGAANKSLIVASGWTDADGNATLVFLMPTTWADGRTLESGKLTLKVTAGDVTLTAYLTYYN